MHWGGKSDRALVDAIVASFSEPSQNSARRLSRFTADAWARTEPWLHISGLALYFLDHVRATHLADTIPHDLLERLEQKLADNQNRTAALLEEFAAINEAFQAEGILYANLKGFTLWPDSCPDPSLRHQSDFDFLIDPSHVQEGRAILEERGYAVTAATERTLEFKCGATQKISFDDRYKALPTRSVELHLAIDSKSPDGSRDERLDRVRGWKCDGATFPALSSADQLIGQALHLLSHLRTEHTRPSWLLEYRRHVLARKADNAFWNEVFLLASGDPDARVALGLSTLLATELFGEFSFPALDYWTAETLSAEIKLWAATYGRRAVLTDVPGTKLHLILHAALQHGQRSHRSLRNIRRLIPLRPPPRILRAPKDDSFSLRVQRDLVQLRYILYRLRFHVEQGFVYVIEMQRWKKLLQKRGHHGSTVAEYFVADPRAVDNDKTKIML